MNRRRVYISQRVDVIEAYKERRDALDQRWSVFLSRTGAIGFPMPNHPQTVKEMLLISPPDGILLTGGADPQAYGGASPERDIVDEVLIKYSKMAHIPLVGVCRGMQSVAIHFKSGLKPVCNHVKTRHVLNGRINRAVNSYHKWAVDSLPSEIDILAYAEDGTPECIRHSAFPIVGLMWHPERESAFAEEDIRLFSSIWDQRIGDVL